MSQFDTTCMDRPPLVVCTCNSPAHNEELFQKKGGRECWHEQNLRNKTEALHNCRHSKFYKFVELQSQVSMSCTSPCPVFEVSPGVVATPRTLSLSGQLGVSYKEGAGTPC